jgi:putative alpha-1,2-mannosidase
MTTKLSHRTIIEPSLPQPKVDRSSQNRVLVSKSDPTKRVSNRFLFSVLSASRVGHLRLTFTETQRPFVLIEASRASVIGSADPTNVTYPFGSIFINTAAREITGSNAERQDFIIGPNPAASFRGYFCARFSESFHSWGTAINGTMNTGDTAAESRLLSGFVTFPNDTKIVDIRIGVSFISIEQARKNLDSEIPDGTSLEETSYRTRKEWADKLDRVRIEGASQDDAFTFYTAIFHTLQVLSCCLPSITSCY